MITIKRGNILDATEDIICHQVNCKGVMGAGLALQIRNKYPEVYDSYMEVYYQSKPKKDLLGNAQIVKCNDGKLVVNLFGQLEYGTSEQQTDYVALHNALDRVFSAVNKIDKYKGKTVALPYKLGCGLAGGDWEVVLGIIKNISEYYNYNVTIYQLEQGE